MNSKGKFIRSRSGFSLVELLVALIIGAILMLTVGVLSQMAVASQKRYNTEMQIYADLGYGFKLMRNRVREHGFTKVPSAGNWQDGAYLELNYVNGAFGIYLNTNSKDFVYVPNLGSINDQEVIVSIPFPISSLNDIHIDLDDTVSRQITARVYGKKNKIPFEISTTVTKRGN